MFYLLFQTIGRKAVYLQVDYLCKGGLPSYGYSYARLLVTYLLSGANIQNKFELRGKLR